MKRIDTEHGPVYIGDPGEHISGDLEPGKRFDENRYRASWAAVTFITTVFFVIGFFIGLVLMGDPDFRLTGFITIIVLALVLRAARSEVIRYESAYMDSLRDIRAGETKLLNIRREVLTLENKQLDAANKMAKADAKEANGLAFTANDFDDAAQALLLKPVKEARKKKVRVTGQGLIETILKGIR